MAIVSKDGKKIYEIPDEYNEEGVNVAAEKAKAKGYTEYIDITKDGKNTFTVPLADIDKAKEKGYRAIDKDVEQAVQENIQAEQEAMSDVEIFTRGMGQGYTSWMDEGMALMQSVIQGTEYEDELKRQRYRQELAESTEGRGYGLGQIAGVAGAVAGGIGVGGTVAKGASTAAKAYTALTAPSKVLGSAAAGAAYSLIENEGAFKGIESEEEKSESRIQALIIGAAFGGALTGLAKGGKAAYNKFKKAPKEAVTEHMATMADELSDTYAKTMKKNAKKDDLVAGAVEKATKSKSANPKKWNLTTSEKRALLLDGKFSKEAIEEFGADKLISTVVKQKQRKAAVLLGREGKTIKGRLDPKDRKFLQNKAHTEDIKQTVKEVQSVEVYEELINKRGFKELRKQDENGMLRAAFRFMSDGRYVADYIDFKYGTNMMEVMDNVGTSMNFMSQVVDRYRTRVNDIMKIHKVNTSDKDSLHRLWDILDGRVEPQTGPEAALVDDMRKLYDDMLEEANATGAVKITRKEGSYVPHTLVRDDEKIIRMEQKAREIEEAIDFNPIHQEASEASIRKMLSTPEGREYIRASEIIFGQEILDKNIRHAINTGDLSKLTRDSIKTRRFNKMFAEAVNLRSISGRQSSINARALQRTKEGIPDFLLDKDVFGSAHRWAQGTFRQVYMEPHIQQLQAIKQQLASTTGEAFKKNDSKLVKWVDNLVTDIQSGGRGLPGEMRDWGANHRVKWRRRTVDALEKGNAKTAALYELIYKTPDMFSGLMFSIYPNVLGFRLSPIVTNLSGMYSSTAAELGPLRYGASEMTSSLFNVMKRMRRSGDYNILGTLDSDLRKRGHIAADFSPRLEMELQDAIREGITEQSGKLGRAIIGAEKVTSKMMEKYTAAAMYFFKKSEIMNRAVAAEMGNRLAKDIMDGSPRALKYLEGKMDRIYARKVRRLLEDKKVNAGEIEFMLEKYMVAKTAMNYNKVTMSEFGRYFGPLVSVFSKWPTAVAGEIAVKMFQQDRGKQVMHKYLTPLALFWGADMAMDHIKDEEDYEGFEALFGKAGLKAKSPIQAPATIFAGDVFAPPVVQSVQEVVRGDISRAFAPWTPGLNIYNTFFKDAPRIFGEKLD